MLRAGVNGGEPDALPRCATPPQAVRDAIRDFAPPAGFAAAPPTKTNSSIIFQWGVRIVQNDDTDRFWWVCLASEHCRQSRGPDANHVRYNMLRGKTSRATNHLKSAHNVVAGKTEITTTNKRRHEDRVETYTNSALYRNDPVRFVVLLETQDRVVINAKVVKHTLLELYACVKREIVGIINGARSGGGHFSLVVDFWTSKVQSIKYIGVRLYMVDQNFQFRSILLGTRQFNPACGHREKGIRYPFQQWIVNILRDFGVTSKDLYGSTIDGGADVKWMMSKGFKLQWEWCMPHLSNAATKAACGLVDDATKSTNRALTKLQKCIVKTVYQTKKVEVMGNLFEELCVPLSTDASTQLLDYRSHRFLGLTRVIERILVKWDVLVEWYGARQANASRRGKPPPVFPLRNHKLDLIQLLSLLHPITANNAMAQAEAPVQVTVLLGLFKLRLRTLNLHLPLRDHRSLLPPAQLSYFDLTELTPLVRATRRLLRDAFHTRFFKRYTDEQAMEQSSFVFEMQLALHPDFKILDASLKPIVMMCNEQHRPDADDHLFNYNKVVKIVMEKLTALMQTFAAPPQRPPQQRAAASEDLLMFGHAFVANTQAINQAAGNEVRDELLMWMRDITALECPRGDGVPELATTYWRRQSQIRRYKLLPHVARMVFSVPASSAQLERDFGVSGMQVTPLRSRMAPHNVDMCAFVNRNREYLDLTQCQAIPEDDRLDHIPSNVFVDLAPYDENNIDFEALPPQIFSNTSIYDDGDVGQDNALDEYDE